MQKALLFATGAAVGFVVGTRAGRRTYEKMRDQSLELWHNPTVQEKVSGATEVVKDKAPQVQHKVGELTKKAAHRGTDTGAAPATGAPLDDAATPIPASTAPAVSPPPKSEHTGG